MYKFSKKSQTQLETCHKDIQLICSEAIKIIDIKVTEGARSQKRQIELFKKGRSKLDGVTKFSKHQVTKEKLLSSAIDILPCPVDWGDKKRFFFVAGIMKGITLRLLEEGRITHALRWGGDWNSNNNFEDQTFNDLPHFELIEYNEPMIIKKNKDMQKDKKKKPSLGILGLIGTAITAPIPHAILVKVFVKILKILAKSSKNKIDDKIVAGIEKVL